MASFRTDTIPQFKNLNDIIGYIESLFAVQRQRIEQLPNIQRMDIYPTLPDDFHDRFQFILSASVLLNVFDSLTWYVDATRLLYPTAEPELCWEMDAGVLLWLEEKTDETTICEYPAETVRTVPELVRATIEAVQWVCSEEAFNIGVEALRSRSYAERPFPGKRR